MMTMMMMMMMMMMMIQNYDESVKINHILNWLYIPNHPHRILIIGGSGSGKLMCY